MWLKGAGVPANVLGAWGPLLGLDSCRFVLDRRWQETLWFQGFHAPIHPMDVL